MPNPTDLVCMVTVSESLVIMNNYGSIFITIYAIIFVIGIVSVVISFFEKEVESIEPELEKVNYTEEYFDSEENNVVIITEDDDSIDAINNYYS